MFFDQKIYAVKTNKKNMSIKGIPNYKINPALTGFHYTMNSDVFIIPRNLDIFLILGIFRNLEV